MKHFWACSLFCVPVVIMAAPASSWIGKWGDALVFNSQQVIVSGKKYAWLNQEYSGRTGKLANKSGCYAYYNSDRESKKRLVKQLEESKEEFQKSDSAGYQNTRQMISNLSDDTFKVISVSCFKNGSEVSTGEDCMPAQYIYDQKKVYALSYCLTGDSSKLYVHALSKTNK